MPICTCPPRRSVTAGAAPRYGMCTMNTPAIAFSDSPAKCIELPEPGVPYASVPGARFANASNSWMVFAGTEGCTAMASGVSPISVTGARSFSQS